MYSHLALGNQRSEQLRIHLAADGVLPCSLHILGNGDEAGQVGIEERAECLRPGLSAMKSRMQAAGTLTLRI